MGINCLNCENTPITSLPPLPPTLRILYCGNTGLTELSELPSLQTLSCKNTPIGYLEEPIDTFIQRYNIEQEKKRSKRRSSAIHEELASVVWHPSRVEKYLEIGGFELLDSL